MEKHRHTMVGRTDWQFLRHDEGLAVISLIWQRDLDSESGGFGLGAELSFGMGWNGEYIWRDVGRGREGGGREVAGGA